MPKNDPTRTEYSNLAEAYDWFNGRLFGGRLPPCLITFNRHAGAFGYYWRDKFRGRRGRTEGRRITAEIALNPDAFPTRRDQDVMATLVHEMVHHWQACFGTPGRGKYHNREWAAKMVAVGLIPSATGRRGGAQTGDRMSHYVLRGGAFAEAWGELYQTGFRVRWQSVRAARGKDRSKQKFTCPACSLNVWCAASLAGGIACVRCDQVLIAVD